MIFNLDENRNSNIDLIRGFAIILMILDHVLVAITSIMGGNDYIYLIRTTLTRFSMPLFMIISGAVLILYGLKIRRWSSVLVTAVVLNIILFFLWNDFNSPEILLVWSLVVVSYKLFIRYPITSLILGFIQAQYFQITLYDYNGYQPGELIFFIVIGIFASNYISSLSFPILSKIYLYNITIAIGRKPLLIYFSHLVFLSIIVNFLVAP